MQKLLPQKVHCLIMTSGTLAPLELFIGEMEMEIPIRLEIKKHIINPNQAFVRILSNGIDGECFDSTFSNRYLKL